MRRRGERRREGSIRRGSLKTKVATARGERLVFGVKAEAGEIGDGC